MRFTAAMAISAFWGGSCARRAANAGESRCFTTRFTYPAKRPQSCVNFTSSGGARHAGSNDRPETEGCSYHRSISLLSGASVRVPSCTMTSRVAATSSAGPASSVENQAANSSVVRSSNMG